MPYSLGMLIYGRKMDDVSTFFPTQTRRLTQTQSTKIFYFAFVSDGVGSCVTGKFLDLDKINSIIWYILFGTIFNHMNKNIAILSLMAYLIYVSEKKTFFFSKLHICYLNHILRVQLIIFCKTYSLGKIIFSSITWTNEVTWYKIRNNTVILCCSKNFSQRQCILRLKALLPLVNMLATA